MGTVSHDVGHGAGHGAGHGDDHGCTATRAVSPNAVLSVQHLHAFYGKSHVLHGVDFDVNRGEIVALLGRNGSGRSTTAKAIMGLVDCTGSIAWNKGAGIGNSNGNGNGNGKGSTTELVGKKAFEIAHLGLGYVPENRDIFPKLTVHQNLILGQKGKGKGSRWSFDDMYSLFPRLKERQHTEAGVLSGGEQQMLTLCRTLMGDPDLIIIDEPTEGLAPKIVELVATYLKTLKAKGISVLLIEQKLTIAMEISDRALVMGHGSIVFQGAPSALRADAYIRKEWLEV
jgi:branched-chain amino acid transport system ATP-binding protein